MHIDTTSVNLYKNRYTVSIRGNEMQKSILFVTNNVRTCNGVATVIMSQYQSLIDAGYRVDILQFLDIPSMYVDEVKANGGKVITYQIKNSKIDNLKTLYAFFKKNHYDIVHVNHTDLIAAMIVWCAKLNGTTMTVYHSHNTKLKGGLKRNIKSAIFDMLCVTGANTYLACSERAGTDVFRKRPFTILHNAINVDKFRFDSKNRTSIRNELMIDDNEFVVGTVCRIADQKNPLYMYDVFAEIIKIRPNSVFLWVGSAVTETDPLLSAMKERAKTLGIEDRIKLVGSKDDPNRWYSAMDVFLMPSKFEGLGITYIEAQANGLPTYASDVVPEDANITPLFHALSLSALPEEWAKSICENNIRKPSGQIDYSSEIALRGYDIQTSKSELLAIYQKRLSGKYE